MAGSEHPKFMFETDFADMETAKEQQKAAEGAQPDDASGIPDKTEEAVEGDAGGIDGEAMEEPEPEPEPEPPTFSEADLAQSRDEGIKAGRDEALKDLKGSLQQKQVDTLEALSTKIVDIFTAYEADKDLHHRNSVAVAGVIVRKLFPALNNEKAIDEIDHIIEDSLSRTATQAWLTFFVAEDLKTEVERLLSEKAGVTGRDMVGLKVIGQPDIPLGDCRVEWEGGGMTRDQNEMWREIDEIIERNLGVLPKALNEGTNEAAPEEAPEAAPEAAPEEAPEAAPEETPEATPEATPEETPEAAPEAAPEEAPEAAPEAAPEEAPEAAPEAAPEEAPEQEAQANEAPSPAEGETGESEDDPKPENP